MSVNSALFKMFVERSKNEHTSELARALISFPSVSEEQRDERNSIYTKSAFVLLSSGIIIDLI